MSEHNPKAWCECEDCTGSMDWIPSAGSYWPEAKVDIERRVTGLVQKVHHLEEDCIDLDLDRVAIRKDLELFNTQIVEQGKKLAELVARTEATLARLNEELELKDKLIKDHRFSDL